MFYASINEHYVTAFKVVFDITMFFFIAGPVIHVGFIVKEFYIIISISIFFHILASLIVLAYTECAIFAEEVTASLIIYATLKSLVYIGKYLTYLSSALAIAVYMVSYNSQTALSYIYISIAGVSVLCAILNMALSQKKIFKCIFKYCCRNNRYMYYLRSAVDFCCEFSSFPCVTEFIASNTSNV